jgi:hypothetical protein
VKSARERHVKTTLQCRSPKAHTSAARGPADFLCLLCFRPGASAAKAGVPRTGRRVQSNLIILSCVVEIGQTKEDRRCYSVREIEVLRLIQRAKAHTNALTTSPKPHQPSKEGQIGAVGPSDKAKLAGWIWDHSASHTMLPRRRTAPNTPTRRGLHFSRTWLQSSHVSMPGHINQRICTSQGSLIAYVCCFVPSMREFRRIPEETKC